MGQLRRTLRSRKRFSALKRPRQTFLEKEQLAITTSKKASIISCMRIEAVMAKLCTNICAGTTRVNEARTHLAYLRELKNRPSGSVFFGDVRREFYNFKKNQIDGGGSPGTVVIIESEKKSFRARSSVKGNFVFAG